MQDEIKRKYLNPTLLLYTYRGCIENSLMSKDIDTATNLIKTDTMNEVSTIEFDIPFSENRKISYDDCEKLIKFDDEYYIIKNIEVTDDSTRNIHVKCEHESTELKGKYCECVKEIGQTPEHIFNAIFNAVKTPIKKDLYKWKGTDVEPSKYRRLITEDESSIYQNLISMAEVFNGWIEITTDENEQKWVYLRTNPINNGKILKKDLDMKSLGITYDSTEIFTQLYGEGSQDEVTGNPITIMSVNPTGKSYLENYSWYVAKGVPLNVIDSEPKYQQLKKISDDTYTSPSDLMSLMEEELKKCSVPTLDATLTMSDLSVYLESTKEPPTVGCEILCIDKQINFIFQCRVTGVERDYNNPLETKIDISNLIRYDTSMQNINHTIDTVDKVTSTNPIDTDGNVTGDGSVYVPACNVKDGDHVNVTMRIGETKTLITQTGEQINLRVDKIDEGYAQIKVESDAITSTVEKYGVSISEIKQTADSITSRVQDISEGVDNTYSEIKQTARKITAVVQEGDESGSWELSKDAFKVAFSGITNDVTTIDGKGIIAQNANGSYTRLGSNGIEHLSSRNGEGTPYHYWTQVGTSIFRDAFDIQDSLVHLEPEFEGSRVRGLASIKEAKCEGPNALNWLASYVSEIDNSDLTATISGHANYRNLEQDDNMETSLEQLGGNITVSWMFIG